MQAIQGAIKVDQAGGGPVIERHVFREKPYAPPGRGITEGLAKHLAATVRRKHEAERQVKRSGLPCSVGTKESKDLAAFHAQRETVECLHCLAAEKAVVFLRDVVEFESRRL